MIVRKTISFRGIMAFAGHHLIWLAGVWIMIPFATIVGWIYVVMELIGDYSENPFEGFGTDVPMLSIYRTIEIDLLEMLGEKDLPKPIQPVRDTLM